MPTGDRFRSTIQELCSLYNVTPSIVAHDAHPDYYSTQFAQTLTTRDAPQPRLISVQHHYAHVLSCLADNQWRSPVLGIAKTDATRSAGFSPCTVVLTSGVSILKTMLQRGLNAPRTSSMGRLFDAIASLLGLCQRSSFEGQAAMQLEYAIDSHTTDTTYPYQIVRSSNCNSMIF